MKRSSDDGREDLGESRPDVGFVLAERPTANYDFVECIIFVLLGVFSAGMGDKRKVDLISCILFAYGCENCSK